LGLGLAAIMVILEQSTHHHDGHQPGHGEHHHNIEEGRP
jgi:hypothetical protein